MDVVEEVVVVVGRTVVESGWMVVSEDVVERGGSVVVKGPGGQLKRRVKGLRVTVSS